MGINLPCDRKRNKKTCSLWESNPGHREFDIYVIDQINISDMGYAID